jgi:hypothetical protein
LGDKRYCSAAFLDMTQAFDKVWHDGLQFKLRKILPLNYFLILKSYLHERYFVARHYEAQTSLHNVHSRVPQGSVLGPMLYLLYTADLLASTDTICLTATFADDTAILASHENPNTASQILQKDLYRIQEWLQKWRIKAKESKSVYITFANRVGNCPPVKFNDQLLPQQQGVIYLGMHLDRRLTWKRHIIKKRKQLGIKFRSLYWLKGRNSELFLTNKLLLYKAILKPVWAYGIQLWGSAANCNLEISERFQSKALRIIVNAPGFISNHIISRDLQIKTVKSEIRGYCVNYNKRLATHPNALANELLTKTNTQRKLKRYTTYDLITRFN